MYARFLILTAVVLLTLAGCRFFDDTADWFAGNEAEIDAVTGAIEDAAPWLPDPVGKIVLVGLGVFGWIRAALNRYAARSIARSVDGVVASAIEKDKSVALELKGDQTSTAKRIVDEAQGKKIVLPV